MRRGRNSTVAPPKRGKLSRQIADVLHRLDQEFDVDPENFKSLHIIAKDADPIATKSKLEQQKYDCDAMISEFVELNHQTFTSSLANVRRAAARFSSARERMSKLPTRVKECRVLHETLHASSELEASAAAQLTGGDVDGLDASTRPEDRDRLSGLVQEERKMRYVVEILSSLERARGVTLRLEQLERHGQIGTAAVLVEDSIEMLESTGLETLVSVKSIVNHLRHQRVGIAAKLSGQLFAYLYEGAPVGRATPSIVASLARERKAATGKGGGVGGASAAGLSARAGTPAPGGHKTLGDRRKSFALLRDGVKDDGPGGGARPGVAAHIPGSLATDRAIAAIVEHVLLPLQHMSVDDGSESAALRRRRRGSHHSAGAGGDGGGSDTAAAAASDKTERSISKSQNLLHSVLTDLSARFEHSLCAAIDAAVCAALSPARRADRAAWRAKEVARLVADGCPARAALIPPAHVAAAHAVMRDMLHGELTLCTADNSCESCSQFRHSTRSPYHM